jgi:hypothetical protein
MELTSKQKGNVTELQCLTAFSQLGCIINIPYGDNARYDFIADVNGKLLKIQVKTASLSKNSSDVVCFSCRSTYVNRKGTHNSRYSKNDIDYFATYWENKCYMIPVSECSTAKSLRFSIPSNGQVQGISFAKDYELEFQLSKIGGSN